MGSAYETVPPHSDWSIGPKPLFTMPSVCLYSFGCA
ncbi:hypothetical protein T09_9168 [Trichinella sp. T9]|nr:hypothetical protein T09_9168 [Trichinella sp. T9]